MTTANRATRIALLIDADNVSPALVAEVLKRLEGHQLQHRRAYGSVQKANEFAELAREHAIRFLPSTFAGPNATDLALAIDAIELVLRQPVDEVVLVSSDRDFAPLIVRLRELGCRVTGFGQSGKSANDVARDYLRVYDDFEVLSVGKTRAPAKPAKPAKRSAAAVVVPALPALPTPIAPPVPAKRTRRAKTSKLAPPPIADDEDDALPSAVLQVLQTCPALRLGEPVRLDAVSAALRLEGVIKKSGKPSALFKKLAAHFELMPPGKPETVRYLASV